MCGIAGYFVSKRLIEKFKPKLDEATLNLKHRGPDDEGSFYDLGNCVGLTHTRLSILDVTRAGHQPMVSDDGNFVIVFNGEIYNFKELKKDLKKRNNFEWRSDSDTEVLLNLYIDKNNKKESFTSFLNKINGIFSIVIWDRIKQEIFLTRDAFGVKPLYYCATNSGVFFASEIKALLPLIPNEDFQLDSDFKTLDLNSINRYLTYIWCPGDGTPHEFIKKLNPGSMITIKQDLSIKKFQWYQLPQFRDGIKVETNSKSKVLKRTEQLIREAVHKQLVSDVPLGAFLSGGLDSSCIVNFARERIPEIACFTIESKGLEEEGIKDDLPYAKDVANHLNVPLEIVSSTPELLTKSLEEMVWQLDEPLADPAALNVFYISKLARENGIKVLLSGAGGDDIFTGYRRHFAIKNERFWTWMPYRLRKEIRNLSLSLPNDVQLARRIKKALSGSHLSNSDRLINYFRWINRRDLEKLYTSDFKEELRCSNAEQPMLDFIKDLPKKTSKIDKILTLEQRFFLTDHNLIYTDKMSMKAGVEVRVPFLDLELVNYVSSLPDSFKQRGREGKWILKKIMEQYLPKKIIYRPKSGFGVPLKSWLRNELKDWIKEILSKNRLQKRGLFNPMAVEQLINENLTGQTDSSYTILSLVCIELWCEQFLYKDKNEVKLKY